MDVNAFVSDHNVRLTWIAFFTQWVLWGLVYFVRHAFGHDSEGPAPAADPEQEGKKKWHPDGAMGVSINKRALLHRSLTMIHSRVFPMLIVC